MLIEARDLVKRYGKTIALDHFHFDLKEGEIVGLLGPNGSGKTTFINCLLGLLRYDKGEIKVFGKEMGPSSWDSKSRIGVIPQDLAVFYELSVRENIDYFCGLYIDDPKRRKELVERAIAFGGLEDYAKIRPAKLSTGLRRRLNIACGVAHEPDLLILDEPTVGVDAQSRAFILDGVKQMAERGCCSVLYTTHYLEEAESLCERIVIMDKGKNLVSGSRDELLLLLSTSEKIHLKLEREPDDILERLYKLEHLENIERSGGDLVLHFEKGEKNLGALLKRLEEEGLCYKELYSERPKLEDVFLAVTGKELRD